MMLSAILPKLQNVKQSGAGYIASCPAHDDHNPSLSITQADDGKILMNCHAGCAPESIVSALGLKMSDLFSNNGHGKPYALIVATYDYQDEAGRTLYQIVRHADKTFRTRRRNGSAGSWIWNLNDTRRVLYHLPQLLARPDETVFIVEGEKDANNLEQIGLLATTNTYGALKWDDKYSESLRGRSIIILPDNDDKGRTHADQVARSVYPLAASVKVVPLPALPEKGDVSDWLGTGGTKEKLLELVEQAQPYTLEQFNETSAPQGNDPPTTDNPDLNKFARTDAGNGEAFAALYGHTVRYDHTRAKWLYWQSPIWRLDSDGELQRLAVRTARARLEAATRVDDTKTRESTVRWAMQSESMFRRRAMLESAAILKPLADAGEWDTDDWLLGCENGVLDLRAGRMIPADPMQRITRRVPIAFDPLATCPRWDTFLAEVFESSELIEFIRRAVGYSMTGDTSEQVVFILYGLGANGKSVFLSILRELLGDYAANTPFQTFEAMERGNSTNDVAALAGMRLVTSSETRESAKLNEARLKSITGGDPITARFLFREYFTFHPKMKLWLAVNHKPKVSDGTFGFWRRVRLIPFTRTFDAQTADPHLLESLKKELPGIFRWGIEGCTDWQNRGLQPPQVVKKATEDYRNEQDAVGLFIAEKCIISDKASATASDLWESFNKWRADDDGIEPLTQTAFGTRLKERGFSTTRKTNAEGVKQTIYKGIGLILE